MATTGASAVFLDTNVLIYAHSTLAPLYAEAVAALQDLEATGTEVWVSRQVLREYLAGMSRRGGFTGTATVASLIADVAGFEVNFRIAENGPAVTTELLRLLATVTVQGKQIHDANIVATMLAHGIPYLLTHNTADFTRFADRDRSPLAGGPNTARATSSAGCSRISATPTSARSSVISRPRLSVWPKRKLSRGKNEISNATKPADRGPGALSFFGFAITADRRRSLCHRGRFRSAPTSGDRNTFREWRTRRRA